jgi:branched-chain amino acid aminotransferase
MIYLNGMIIPEADARIDPADRGFLLGDGLFETMRAYQGQVFKLDAHLDRLFSGAEFLNIPVPLRREEFVRVTNRLLQKNELREGDASLRITLTRGVGPRGILPPVPVRPTLLITAHEFLNRKFPPARAVLANRRRNETSPLCGIKSLNYLENILARQEAMKAEVDEALVLNGNDDVVEATTANVFFVMDGKLYTAPVQDGALPGITRDVVLDLARKMGREVIQKSHPVEVCVHADEAFLTNSLIEIRPLVAINHKKIGTGEVGPLTLALQEAYREIVRAETC